MRNKNTVFEYVIAAVGYALIGFITYGLVILIGVLMGAI
jgi:hypothetical protein